MTLRDGRLAGPSFGRSLLLVLILAVAAVSLLPASAMARTGRVLEGHIGAVAQGEPTALAVDQANGDIYVIDATVSVHKVYRFDSSGAPKNFTAGPDAGTNTLTGFVPKSNPFNHQFTTGPNSIAIDNSGGPLDGTIYVAEGQHSKASLVKAFDRSGASLGLLDGSGAPPLEEEPVGQISNPHIAVDQSDGSLYVANPPAQRLWRYVPASATVPLSDADYTVTGTLGSIHGIGAPLAAHEGNVYSAGVGNLYRYSVADFSATPQSIQSAPILDTGVTAVAVDPATGDVYANEGYRVAVFDDTDELLYRFGRVADVGVGSRAVAVKSAASGAATKAYAGHAGIGAVAVFGPPTAVPSYVHPEIAAFGPDGTAATAFGSGNTPQAAAFEQAGRKLYTVEPATGIYGFDASSPPAFSPLTAFNPLTTPDPAGLPRLAVDNTALASAGNVYRTSTATGLLYGYSAAGVPLGGAFPIDPAVAPGAPEGSPKDLRGIAVDSTGSIWVSNASTKRILEYSSTGAFQGSIDTSTLPVAAAAVPGQLAIDSSDDLYVEVGGAVWRYTASSGYTSATRVASPIGNTASLTGITVNPSNDYLYIAYASSDFALGQAKQIAWVAEYDAAGALVDEFVVGVAGSAFPSGLTVDAASGNVYLADVQQHKLRAFGPGALLPEVATAPASNFANTAVTLNGTVSTQGVALTDCHFEYVTEAAFAAGGFADLSSGGSVPCSPAAGSIPLDLASHPVSATAGGLVKATEYRFRLSAANAQGANVSGAGRFSTAALPDVETVGAPVRSATTAHLNGRVNPRNAGTTYHFEYGTQGPCGSNPCQSTPPRAAGSGVGIEFITERVAGLQPGTTYHYRLVADNGNVDGPVAGQDFTVTTSASDAPLSHGQFPGPPGSDRAYEQVSLPDSGGNPVSTLGPPLVSEDGDRVIYQVHGGTPITESGSSFGNVIVAERPAGAHPQSGWRSRAFTPKRSAIVGNPSPVWKLEAVGDLSSLLGVAENLFSPVFAAWSLPIPGEPEALFMSTPDQLGSIFGVSADGSRKVLGLIGATADPAYPTAGEAVNLYDVSTGSAQLASILPNGLPACVARSDLTAGDNMPSSEAPWISADGSLLFFASSGDASNCESSSVEIFVRDLESGQSTAVSGAAVSGLTCHALLLRTTPAAAYFWTKSRLDAGDTAPSSCGGGEEDGDVYRYDLGAGGRVCLTCVVPGRDADVLVNETKVSGAEKEVGVAADGSRVYFQSKASLLRGAPEAGERAVYRVDVAGGDIAYVAPAISNTAVLLGREALSADGSVLTFRSKSEDLNPLGGTNNGETDQFYRYDDRDRSLICVSCAPEGTVAKNDAVVGHLMAADGDTIAFTTPEPLLGADQNTPGLGVDPRAGTDLYEWRDGRLLLATDGLTRWPTKGLGFPAEGPKIGAITPSGRDIYFTAPIQYTTDALDGYRRLYTARIGGGIDFPAPPQPCPLEVCQGIPNGIPAEPPPATSNFRGPGNPAAAKGARKCPAGKRKVRRKSRTVCVKRRSEAKREHGKGAPRRAAKHNGGDNR